MDERLRHPRRHRGALGRITGRPEHSCDPAHFDVHARLGPRAPARSGQGTTPGRSSNARTRAHRKTDAGILAVGLDSGVGAPGSLSIAPGSAYPPRAQYHSRRRTRRHSGSSVSQAVGKQKRWAGDRAPRAVACLFAGIRVASRPVLAMGTIEHAATGRLLHIGGTGTLLLRKTADRRPRTRQADPSEAGRPGSQSEPAADPACITHMA